VHALEVPERGDRLRVAARVVVGLGDLQLGFLGARVEGMLVEERLVALDGELPRLVVEGLLALAPELLRRDDRLLRRARDRDERDGQYDEPTMPG